VDHLARRRLTAPAIFALESLRPVSFVASQGLVVLGPIIRPFVGEADYDVLCDALEDRENVGWLIQRLEQAEAGATGGDSAGPEDPG